MRFLTSKRDFSHQMLVCFQGSTLADEWSVPRHPSTLHPPPVSDMEGKSAAVSACTHTQERERDISLEGFLLVVSIMLSVPKKIFDLFTT